MMKHTRYDTIKPLIESGHIKEFRQIFDIVPKTAVAKDLGIHFNRFNGFIEKVGEMKISDMYLLCSYFVIEPDMLFKLINEQHSNTRKGTKKK